MGANGSQNTSTSKLDIYLPNSICFVYFTQMEIEEKKIPHHMHRRENGKQRHAFEFFICFFVRIPFHFHFSRSKFQRCHIESAEYVLYIQLLDASTPKE